MRLPLLFGAYDVRTGQAVLLVAAGLILALVGGFVGMVNFVLESLWGASQLWAWAASIGGLAGGVGLVGLGVGRSDLPAE